MEQEDIAISPLFVGLTRPPMMMGVTIEYMLVAIFIPMVLFSFGQSFLYLLAFVPLYVLGWGLCRIDPNIFKILVKKMMCVNTPNKSIWRAQCYEPY